MQQLADPQDLILLDDKVRVLREVIARLDRVVVAFSGGTDSTLLLAVCLDVLGRDRVLAVTANSPTLPASELAEAVELAAELGAQHVTVVTREMEDERFVSNPRDRCYYCKQELFGQLHTLAEERGYRYMVYGATADDLDDYRPGMQAAREAQAVAPLLEAGFTKSDVRHLSRQMGLRTWNKPAMACLSSRFPYGDQITVSKLSQVERAEEFLRRELGFRDVRVRHHDTIARIELGPQEMGRLLEGDMRARVVSRLQEIGYTYITLDLAGFRSGSMNAAPVP